MRTLLRLALALSVAAAPMAVAQESWVHTIKPYKPRTVTFEDGAICGPFVDALTASYDDKPIKEMRDIWPSAGIIPIDAPDEGYRSLPIDFDGDGDNEILHIDSYTIGWRYLGVHLYLFETEADYAVALADKTHRNHSGLDMDGFATPIAGVTYRELGQYDNGSALIRIGNKLLTGQDASLIWLNAPGQPRALRRPDDAARKLL